MDTCWKGKATVRIHNDLGGWKASKQGEEINSPTIEYGAAKNELLQTPAYESKTIGIVDEYDADSKTIESTRQKEKPKDEKGRTTGHRKITNMPFLADRH